jgi:hypothetical protein
MSEKKRVKIPLHRLVESIAAYYQGLVVIAQETGETYGAHDYIAVSTEQEVEVELDEELAGEYTKTFGLGRRRRKLRP